MRLRMRIDGYSLETLNISSNPLDSIPESSDKPPLTGLKNLILLSTPLDSLASLLHLSDRFPNLNNLRFSIDSSPLIAGAARLSGNDEEDRGVLLVLFPKLIMLNGNEVRVKEREEAERRFCSRHTALEDRALEALLERLVLKHGLQTSTPVVPEKTSLRSKMISEFTYRQQLM